MNCNRPECKAEWAKWSATKFDVAHCNACHAITHAHGYGVCVECKEQVCLACSGYNAREFHCRPCRGKAPKRSAPFHSEVSCDLQLANCQVEWNEYHEDGSGGAPLHCGCHRVSWQCVGSTCKKCGTWNCEWHPACYKCEKRLSE